MPETYLKQYFAFSAFRPGQKEIVESILAGKDVVALMPTGGGKSLCYQLPAVMSDSVSIVISPLIALMKDQVDSLRARGIPAAFINSSLSPAENHKNLRDIEEGKCRLIYAAPERLGNAEFRNIFARQEVKFLAVDEAHCVSQWGHDFRPDYMRIKDFIQSMPKRPAIAAFTATATPEVKNEIITRLGLQNPEIFIRGFDRPNLKFFVRSELGKRDRISEVLRIVKSMPGNGIVYSITRNGAEELAGFLNENNISAAAYHAGMDSEARTRTQNDFMENRFKVIVATIAFGMGVDKADIRFVIHAGMPASLEGYYQEAGRAGRDGDPAFCILLSSNSDFGLHYHFILKAKQEMRSQGKNWEEINAAISLRYERLERMRAYANEYSCRRKKILDYFSDPDAKEYAHKKCDNCDVCLNYKWSEIAPDRKRSRRRRVMAFEDATAAGAKDFDPWRGELPRNQPDQSLSETVMETARLYQKSLPPEQIAKARSMAQSTIIGHLIRWYQEGGELKIGDLISPEEEKQILHAMAESDDYCRLGAIKAKLPENVSYEKIRLVIAKIQGMKA